jgi:hypothetical protein
MGPATASSTGLRLVGHHDLGGNGDGMQLMRAGDVLYVGHTGTTKAGTSILDVADPTAPRLVTQWPAPPNTHTHKVQVADGLLLVNHERFPYRPTAPLGPHSAGVAVYTLDDPLRPEPLSFWESGGKGVHRIVWEGGRYAHMSATPAGFRDRIWLSIDLEDPAVPRLAGRWWVPGQADDEPAYQPPAGHAHGDHFRVAAHHALVAGGFAYLGYDDANLVVLDVTDFAHPVQVGGAYWGGGATHTALPLPGRGLLVVTDEQQIDGPQAPTRGIHLLDISDPVSPRYLRQLPEPEAAYRELPSRFGAHNLHENRAGSYRSERFVFATYFSGGVRVYDLADADEPVEIAHWVPQPPPGQDVTQLNDLFVDDDLTVWVSERHTGGIYALRPDDDLAALLDGARS